MHQRYILLDIEGTTTPIAFVHNVLFPYSRQRLASYVREREAEPTVAKALEDTKATVLAEGGEALSSEGCIQQLLVWLDADRKHPALKTLQGLIWEQGYQSGAYTSELYSEVAPMLMTWRERGWRLGIYSSGSTQAQKLLFQYTTSGDLRPLLHDYFDTSVGGKKEAESYVAIAKQLRLQPAEILFLSDAEAELIAATAAGAAVIHIVRPGTAPVPAFRGAGDFLAVDRLLHQHQGGRP